MDLTLIIPARNEESRLPAGLAAYWSALAERYGDRFEIVVVTNGCTDRTVAVAEDAARSLSRVRVHDIPAAVGKGGAVLEGFRQARGARVAFADADAAVAAASVLDLVTRLDDHDIAIGSRRLPGSAVLRPQSPVRRACGALFTGAVRSLFDLPYRDTQCGAKAFRREAAARLAARVEETRWAFDVDLLLTAATLDLRVVEVPITWTNGAGSGVRIIPTALEILGSLRRMRRRHAAGVPTMQHEPASFAEMPPAPAAEIETVYR